MIGVSFICVDFGCMWGWRNVEFNCRVWYAPGLWWWYDALFIGESTSHIMMVEFWNRSKCLASNFCRILLGLPARWLDCPVITCMWKISILASIQNESLRWSNHARVHILLPLFCHNYCEQHELKGSIMWGFTLSALGFSSRKWSSFWLYNSILPLGLIIPCCGLPGELYPSQRILWPRPRVRHTLHLVASRSRQIHHHRPCSIS